MTASKWQFAECEVAANDHIHGFSPRPGTEIAALCDVDESVLNHRLGDHREAGIAKPKSYVDVRKLLEDKDIGRNLHRYAQSLALADGHLGLPGGERRLMWKSHARITAFEGRQLVRAVRKYNPNLPTWKPVAIQPRHLEAMKHMRDGTIGDVYMARALCYKWRASIGHASEEPVPAGVNYDLWDRTGAAETVYAQPLSLQLALDLGHG